MVCLDAREYEDFITGDGVHVIDMWAPWCGPCRAFAPTFEFVASEMEGRNPRTSFAKVDVDMIREVAFLEDVTSVPTVIIYRDGERISSHVGALTELALREVIEAVLA